MSAAKRAQNNCAESLAEQPEATGDPEGCRPFLKWAGGKSRLLHELRSRLPEQFRNYFEPFVGGGALYFGVAPLEHPRSESANREAVLSDINNELINAYRVVQQQLEELLIDLRRHTHTSRYFYHLRNADRDPGYWTWSPVERASRLIYLNRTCFNGLYRVNSRGEFNVPFGDYKNPTIVDEKNLRACSARLQGVSLRLQSFEKVVEDAQQGDFVYFDPPYVPLSATSHFTGYTKEGFSDDVQLRLRDVCIALDRKGVKVMVSNSSAPLIHDLYRDFRIEIVYAPRAINSKGDKRGRIEEVIVRNY